MARCSLENVTDVDPTIGYMVADFSGTKDEDYYGYVNSELYQNHFSWFIIKESYDPVTDSNSFRYCKGTDDYPTQWNNRTLLTYDYYDVVF